MAAEIRRNTTPNNFLVNDNNFSAILDSERTDGLVNFEIDPTSNKNAQSNSPERLGSHNLNFNTDKAPLAQTSHIVNPSKQKAYNNKKPSQASAKNAFKQRKSGDNTITTTAGTKLNTNSEAGRNRKNSAPGTNYYKQVYLQAEKQHSGPVTSNASKNPLQQRQKLVPQPRSGSNPVNNNEQSNPTWLARKHPRSEYEGAQQWADNRAVQRYGGDVKAATD